MDYENQNIPEYVNISTMAKMLGLSRARLYQLIDEGVFLKPKYVENSKRPLYTRDMIIKNLEVKRNNNGINGTIVMFYAQRSKPNTRRSMKQPKKTFSKQTKQKNNTALIEDLEALGLTDISEPDVESALSECYPDGTAGVSEDEILTSVFRHIKRQNPEHKPRT